VSTEQGTPVGTLVTQIFHDHTQFRIPHAPGILALEETENQAIVEALAHASVRLRGVEHREADSQKMAVRQAEPGWEYSVEVGLADYLDPNHLEISEGMLDGALSLWGRNGWELVTAIPYQGRMIAFFKRPMKGNV